MRLQALAIVAGCSFVTGCFERDGIASNATALQVGRTSLVDSAKGPFLRYDYPGDEGNAGSFDYRHFDPSAFSIVGAGTDSTTRRIHLWDDVVVGGRTYVSNSPASISAGKGAPSAKAQSGSIYLRTDGGAGARLYVSAGNGQWHAVKGV